MDDTLEAVDKIAIHEGDSRTEATSLWKNCQQALMWTVLENVRMLYGQIEHILRMWIHIKIMFKKRRNALNVIVSYLSFCDLLAVLINVSNYSKCLLMFVLLILKMKI